MICCKYQCEDYKFSCLVYCGLTTKLWKENPDNLQAMVTRVNDHLEEEYKRVMDVLNCVALTPMVKLVDQIALAKVLEKNLLVKFIFMHRFGLYGEPTGNSTPSN